MRITTSQTTRSGTNHTRCAPVGLGRYGRVWRRLVAAELAGAYEQIADRHEPHEMSARDEGPRTPRSLPALEHRVARRRVHGSRERADPGLAVVSGKDPVRIQENDQPRVELDDPLGEACHGARESRELALADREHSRICEDVREHLPAVAPYDLRVGARVLLPGCDLPTDVARGRAGRGHPRRLGNDPRGLRRSLNPS